LIANGNHFTHLFNFFKMKNSRLYFAGARFGKDLLNQCMALVMMAGFLLAFYPSKAQEPPCSLDGYTNMGTYNGHTYYLSDFTVFGPDAIVAAAATGGHLATIADAGEDAFVSAAAYGGWAWIGFSDVAVEGTFVWETGEPVTYTNWCPNEPNNCCSGEDWTTINWCGSGWNDLYDGVAEGDYYYSLPLVVEFDGVDEDDDCDGVLNCSDVCPGGNDNGPCSATSLPPGLPSDWYCSNNNNSEKIKVCHDGNTICISESAVETHLAHGDFLGPCASCSESYAAPIGQSVFDAGKDLDTGFTVYPNPSNGDFRIMFNQRSTGVINVIDQKGQIVMHFNLDKQQYLDIRLMSSGVYFIQHFTDQQVLSQKITVLR
jgi:hypothetical protein